LKRLKSSEDPIGRLMPDGTTSGLVPRSPSAALPAISQWSDNGDRLELGGGHKGLL